ncbi:MAG: MFS transporter [Verrucomicrobiia bacterium]|jgi:ACS family hexuronate transporter-like MFS transporter
MNKQPIKHLRWYIAVLLCLASALNYLDRQTLSVLIGTIKADLGLNNADYGAINAWFLASYGVMYAVSGLVIDRIGTRRGFTLFVSGWSLANMLHIFAATVGQFSFFRFLLGVFEPGSFTGGMRAVSEWFPMRDRALAVGIFNAGTAFGSMFAAPVVSFIAFYFGWRAAFLVTGALGFVWVAAWMLLFKLPKDHPRLGEEERQLILADRSEESEQPVSLLRLLRMRETWGCVLVRVLTDPISYFLLFWMPLYFQHSHGFDLKQIGMFVWIPYAVAAVGNIFGGAMPRWLISRGWELNRARKTTMTVMTFLMPAFCVLATQVSNPALALVIVAGMTFCHASWGNITLVAEVFPKNAVGTVTGLGGALGSLMSALSQLYIGRVVEALGFAPIFIACAVLYPVALLLVQLMIGKLGVVRKV